MATWLKIFHRIYLKLSCLGWWFFFLAGFNISLAFLFDIEKFALKYNLNSHKVISLFKFIIYLEISITAFLVLVLLTKGIKYLKEFFQIKLTYRIILGFVLGITIGIIIRNNPIYSGILGIKAENFKILGDIFLDLIRMSIGPLIFASITSSVMGEKNSGNIGTMALKSFVCFLAMTLISVVLGIVATNIIKPGMLVNKEHKSFQSIVSGKDSNAQKAISKIDKNKNSGSNIILDAVPSNIFKSFYDANFLQIIFFSAILGVAIKKSNALDGHLAKSIRSLNDVMFKLTDFIMQFATFGIFGFTVWVVGSQDLSLIKSLGIIILIVYGGILFLVYVMYSLFILFALRLNPLKFFRKMAPVQIMGYLLASSSAMLPQSLKIAEQKLGVSREKALFIIPFGATVNMNGTALNLAVSVIFISQIFGVSFSMEQYIYIIALCTLGAVGTAPIPGASIFLLSGILGDLNLPIGAIGFILAIDRILDMARTFGNITGDVLSGVIVDRFDNTLNKKIWNSK